MLTPKMVKALDIRAPTVTDIIPSQRSADAATTGFYPPTLFGLQVTGHATDAPTINDDETTGHVAPMFWVRASPFEIYLATSVADGAAVWTNITAQASITGLTNPLAESLNANAKLIYNAAFAGFRDRYYDLEVDPSNLVTGGVAALNAVYNAWYHGNVDSELTIRFPDPSYAISQDAMFGIVVVRLAAGGSVVLDDTYPWGWEKANTADPDPVLESAEFTHLRLRYQYDPVAERYSVFAAYLTYEPPAPEIEAVTYVEGSFTTHTPIALNGDSVSHTHQFTSTEQDGHLGLLVLVAADSDSSKPITSSNYPAGLTEIGISPSLFNNIAWAGYIFPSPAQLAAGFPMTWSNPNEGCQIMALELHGLDPTTPFTDVETLTVSSGTSIGPASVTTGRPNSLVIALAVGDESRDVTTSTANGYTEVYVGASNAARGGHVVSLKAAPTADTYDTPVYAGSSADRMNLLAFAAQPPEAA